MSVPLNEFADKLSRIMPTIMKEFGRRQASELYKGKITFPQLVILDFLHAHEESKMKDLALFLNVTTAAMTGIVDRLVRYGYLARSYDCDDRRIIKVKLTAKGNNLVRKVNVQRRMMFIEIFSRVSENDRQEYLRILMQIRDILTEKDYVKR